MWLTLPIVVVRIMIGNMEPCVCMWAINLSRLRPASFFLDCISPPALVLLLRALLFLFLVATN